MARAATSIKEQITASKPKNIAKDIFAMDKALLSNPAIAEDSTPP
jgi:hypothetical protein